MIHPVEIFQMTNCQGRPQTIKIPIDYTHSPRVAVSNQPPQPVSVFFVSSVVLCCLHLRTPSCPFYFCLVSPPLGPTSSSAPPHGSTLWCFSACVYFSLNLFPVPRSSSSSLLCLFRDNFISIGMSPVICRFGSGLGARVCDSVGSYMV